MKNVQDFIVTYSDILGGQPVFKGTRVLVVSLFDHLDSGITVMEFMEDFPSVKKEQITGLLAITGTKGGLKKLKKLYKI